MKQHLLQATTENPLRIYIGSCPDYSNDGTYYTHENLGKDTPLLTRVHLENDREILYLLDASNIAYEYILMLADVEAEDEVFCNRFTHGSKEEFFNRCRESVDATREHLKSSGFGERIKSSSFYMEFGRNEFLFYQNNYQENLSQRYEVDSSFRTRVDGDVIARGEMYSKMYRGVLDKMNYRQAHEFLVGRTIRTMAQYLTLGRLIGQNARHPVIICHPTRNIGMFNDRNKFTLPEDGPQPQPTIPVIEMKRRVY